MTPFEELVVRAGAALAGLGALWVTAIAVALLADARAGARTETEAQTSLAARLGCPRRIRTWLIPLLAGLLLSAPGGASADAAPDSGPPGAPHSALDGLGVPDRIGTRVTLRQGSREISAPAVSRTMTVQPGDSLWSIARRRLPPSAGDPAIAAASRQIHRRNRAVIGANPDLIEPGQRLRLTARLSTPPRATTTYSEES